MVFAGDPGAQRKSQLQYTEGGGQELGTVSLCHTSLTSLLERRTSVLRKVTLICSRSHINSMKGI